MDVSARLQREGRKPALPVEACSQWGEDVLLWDLFGGKTDGFFIEAGAFDGYTFSVTYLLDGGVNNNLLNNLVVYNPNPDTVEEFRILTSNYTPEYGRTGGGVVSVVTKSGTNQPQISQITQI